MRNLSKNQSRGIAILCLAMLLGAVGAVYRNREWLRNVSRRLREPASTTATDDVPDDDEGSSHDRVRLASPQVARRIGIETACVVTEHHAHLLNANAETAYDGRRYTEVLARVTGIVREAYVEPGQVVDAGDVLAVLDSATVGNAKVQYRTALATADLAKATYDRLRTLAKQEIVAGKSELESLTALTQAQNNLLDAEQKLRNLGFQDDDLQRIAAAQSTTNLIDVAAPISGHIVVWDATIGDAVEPVTPLFIVADTKIMWLWIDVYESEIDHVRIGQSVTFTISGGSGARFTGTIATIGTEVDRVTRTTKVRAELANPEGRLRANQFGRAEIEVEREHEAIVVPAAAVQRDLNDEELVFLPDGDEVFVPRRVITRAMGDNDKREVAEGLKPGDQVVTTGAFLLLSELHKDRIAEDVD